MYILHLLYYSPFGISQVGLTIDYPWLIYGTDVKIDERNK